VNHPRILGIGTANPPVSLSQEQSFHAAGYQGERIRKIFLNSDIEYRHFYLEGALNRKESSDQLNQHYLRGARFARSPDFSERSPIDSRRQQAIAQLGDVWFLAKKSGK
jgi:hypothetical protein